MVIAGTELAAFSLVLFMDKNKKETLKSMIYQHLNSTPLMLEGTAVSNWSLFGRAKVDFRGLSP